MACARVLDAARNARQRALVQHGVDALAGTRNGVRVGEIGGDELDLAGDGGEIFAAAGREIIEPANVLAARYESLGKMRADEACDARDEMSCHCGSSLRGRLGRGGVRWGLIEVSVRGLRWE